MAKAEGEMYVGISIFPGITSSRKLETVNHDFFVLKKLFQNQDFQSYALIQCSHCLVNSVIDCPPCVLEPHSQPPGTDHFTEESTTLLLAHSLYKSFLY